AKSAAPVAAGKLSETAQRNAADKNVLFFEDFSAYGVGTTPTQWTTSRHPDSGDPVMVTKLKGTEGNWIKLNQKAVPKKFTQITGDFELKVDVAVVKGDVPWGTPGMDIQLLMAGTEGDRKITFNVSPGDLNRKDAEGWLMIEGLKSCKVAGEYTLTGYLGSRDVNVTTITIQRK